MVVALAALTGFVALAISMSDRGDAAFPGSNGKIAYSFGDAYMTSIWSANPDGGAPTKLTNGTGDWAPAYSADGSRIAFSRDNGVAVMNADGSGLTQLLPGTYSSSSNTEWQEDYETPGPGSKTIPFVKIQTSTEDWHSFYGPAFSPDGSQLAVGESTGKSIFTSICAVENNEDQVCISGYENPDAYFDFDYECVGCTTHLITVSSTTGARTGEITPPSESTDDYGPAYSPNGQLAFTRSSMSGSSIFLVNSPGAAPTQLTAGPNDYSPDFSPDGSRLIFNHGSRELGLIGVGGGPVSILSVPNPPGATWSYMDSPAFSPDGTRVTFQRYVSGPGGKLEAGVFTMGADGSGPVSIVNDGYDPNWQPIPLPPSPSPSPPPPPPATPAKAKGKKGAVRLNKKGQAVVGIIACGSSPCTLKALSALLKVRQPKAKGKNSGKKSAVISKKRKGQKKGKARNKTYRVGSNVPKRLAPGARGKVKVSVRGKALGALRRARKGALTVKVRVTDTLGKKVVTLKTTLKPPKGKKSKGGRKKGGR